MLHTNIIFSALLKAVGLGCSFVIVPLTLGYLNNEVYGIWMTLTSILYWFSFFDIGLGNGMRNYLTEAISRKDFAKARGYLSTTLLLVTAIATVIGLAAIGISLAIDPNALFNTQAIGATALHETLLVAIAFTMVMFVVKNIGLVFVALQKYAMNDFLLTLGSVVSLLIVYLLTRFTEANLLYVVLAFTATPAVVMGLAAIPVFVHYSELRPSLHDVDFSLARQIVGKGLGFFFIQITSCLVVYGASNLFITQMCGPASVTVYNIAYKFFNLLAVGYTIVVSPMWNAYTDAYVKGDLAWIDGTFRKAMRLWALTVAGGALMLALCGWFYGLWVGASVEVPMAVSASVWAYICMFNLNNCVTALLNGLNKIRVQILTSFVGTALYIAAVCLFGKEMGMTGIVCSMAVCYGAMAAVHFYQCRLIIRGKAHGIWDK